MSPPVIKKKKMFSSENSRLISSIAIGERAEQQPMGSLMTSLGKRRSVRVAKKMNKRIFLKKIWICNDVWMDIFPCFDRPQLGLKLAILSPRFNALVDKHFEGKSELTIWREIKIHKDKGTKPKLSVRMNRKFVEFPLLGRPMPSKIRFSNLEIEYIDHSVIAFLRLNHQIFDKKGTNLHLWIPSPHTTDGQLIWDIFVRELLPIFSANIRHLDFSRRDHLDNLLRRTPSTILTDLNQLNSIYSHDLLPEAIGDNFDGPNSTISAGQALSKWLHSARKDGQPKRLRYCQGNFEWINNFKENFLCANAISSVSYEIHFYVRVPSMPMMTFELVNEWTQEKLTLAKANENEWDISWIMKRCKIIGETAAVNWEDGTWDNSCNNVFFWLFGGNDCIGPLSPPPTKEDEAGQSITNGPSSADK